MQVTRYVRKAADPILIPFMIGRSATYMYPLQGIQYFATRPILWAYLFTILVPEIVLTAIVYTLFYIFLYPPQATMAIFFNGPSGMITAAIALLHESAVAAHLISNMFLLPTPLRLLFDAVLSREGFDDLVLKGKLRRTVNLTPVQKVKRSIKQTPKSIVFPLWFVQCIVRICLHFIPFAGPVILILIDGPKHGKKAHQRYFELKGMDEKAVKSWVSDRRAQYMGFGIVAGALESVPFVGLVFSFTNTVAGALWAITVERRIQQQAIKPKRRLIQRIGDAVLT